MTFGNKTVTFALMFNQNIVRIIWIWMVVFLPFESKAGEFSLATDGAPQLTLSSSNPNQGVLKLEWSLSDETRSEKLFELQQATDAGFKTARSIYQGVGAGTFISGLEDGTYYYRVRVEEGSWSAPLSIEIKHHSLKLAIFLMAIGAAVFLITLLMILRASKKIQST